MKHKLQRVLKTDPAFFFFILILTFFIYSFSFFNEFVSDDIAGIANNPALGILSQQLKTLYITNTVSSLIYIVFGPVPFWYHLFNTAIHLMTVIVVYFFAYVLTGNKFISRVTSFLFAVHPIETEGVTWISGAPYAVYTFFLYLSLLAFIAVEKMKLSLRWLLLSIFFYLLALRSSVAATILPGIFLIYLLLFSKMTWPKIKLLFPSLIVGIIYGLTLIGALFKRVEDLNAGYVSKKVVIISPLYQIPIAVYSYLKLLFFPLGLTLYHENMLLPKLIYYFSIIIFLGLLGLIFAFWKKHKILVFGLCIFLITLTPTLLPIMVAWIVAERYVHAGSVGIFLSFSYLLFLFQKRFKKIANFVNVMLIIIFISLSVLTVKRNLEWKNQDTLWPATVKASPDSAYAHNNMGDYYSRHGDFQRAIQSFSIATKIRPGYAEATHNLGYTYFQIKDYDNAIKYLTEALGYNPKQYQSAELLGQIYFEKKDYKKSEEYVLQGVKYNPDPLKDYVYLFVVYKNLKDENKANEALNLAIQIASTSEEKKRSLNSLLNNIVRMDKE